MIHHLWQCLILRCHNDEAVGWEWLLGLIALYSKPTLTFMNLSILNFGHNELLGQGESMWGFTNLPTKIGKCRIQFRVCRLAAVEQRDACLVSLALSE